MSKITCEIIKDLIPLYYDEVCSTDSSKVVEEHIIGCSNCKRELDNIKKTMELPKNIIEKNKSESNVIKGLSKSWDKSKRKSFFKGLITTMITVTVVIGAYITLCEWDSIKVPMSVVEISGLSKLSNGMIIYNTKFTDGYDVNTEKFTMDEEGNFYVTPYRPIIKSKGKWDIRPNDEYNGNVEVMNRFYKGKYGEKAELKKLYFGSPEDNILIWEEGMEVPAASDEVEKNNIYNYN